MRILSADDLERCGLGEKTHVLLAFSGGSDSTALLFALHEAWRAGEISALSAAHFNHGLRGADADADERFCRELCARLGVSFYRGNGDVRGLARREGKSVEEAARTLRYAFLLETMHKIGADCIATAHHANDQAETLLLHLLRGAGLTGLCGMLPVRGRIIRPFLGKTHEELLAFLRERGERYCTDATNADTAYARNRVRRELLPLMQSFQPEIVRHLASTASLLAEEEAYLQSVADKAKRKAEAQGGYDRNALRCLPRPVQRRVLLTILRETLAYDVRRKDVERLEELLAGQPGGCIELRQGKHAWLDENILRLGVRAETPTFCEPFMPGEICRTAGWRIRSKTVSAYCPPSSAFEACLSLDRVCGSETRLYFRSRRAGDRFRPLGGPGERLLSDVFTDRKTPERLRGVPLLCTDNEILFVPGYTVAERVRVTAESKRIIYIKLEEDLGFERQELHDGGH